MGNKTLTLNKQQATEPPQPSTSPIDRYETGSVKLHARATKRAWRPPSEHQ